MRQQGAVERRMVRVSGGRHVHCRIAGAGMPVFLLHQSPMSSAEFAGLILDLAERYLVIAPDTPGNGLSDPLPGPDETADMAEYADALSDLMDALGLDRAAVYGFHTGALCALEFAKRHPDRLIVAVANGYVDLPAEMRRDLLDNYFAPVAPDWCGGHLHWWWMRFREQHNFFPWYRRERACRTGYDMPGAEALHASMLEVMRVGDSYRRPYRAAIAHDSLAALQATRAPVTVMVDRTDLLFPCLDLIVDPSPTVEVRRPDTPADAVAVLQEVLARHAADAPPAILAGPAADHDPGVVERAFVATDAGALYARRAGPAGGVPILFIPDPLESGARWEPVMLALASRRGVLALDPPGCGESDDWSGDGDAVEVQAQGLAAGLAQLGVERVDIAARHRGAPLALALARRLGPDRVRLALGAAPAEALAVAAPVERLAPPVVIDEMGGHFAFVWNMLRDQELYAPWFARDAAHAVRSVEPDIEPNVIHRRTVDFFLAIARYPDIVASTARFDAAAARAELAPAVRDVDGAPADPGSIADRYEQALGPVA